LFFRTSVSNARFFICAISAIHKFFLNNAQKPNGAIDFFSRFGIIKVRSVNQSQGIANQSNTEERRTPMEKEWTLKQGGALLLRIFGGPCRRAPIA
jgi:hypothetical protein